MVSVKKKDWSLNILVLEMNISNFKCTLNEYERGHIVCPFKVRYMYRLFSIDAVFSAYSCW